MKNSAKIIVAVLALVTLIGGCFMLSACDKNVSTAEALEVKEIELTSESYAFGIKKGNTTLKTAANDLLDEIKADGTLESIINAFFDGTSTFTHTNPVSKDNCLVVSTNAYFPPFEYYDGDKLTGIDIQIASLLAAKLGKSLYVDDMQFDSVLTSVGQGLADIAMAGITVNATRLESYDFTDEYYESAQVLIVKASDTDFDNCTTAAQIEDVLKTKDKAYTIGTQKATTGYMYSNGDADFGYDGFTNLSTAAYSNGALAAQDLSNGKINAVIIDKQPALMITKSINDKIK